MFDEENRGWRAIVVLGISLMLSLILLIVAGAVYNSWVPMVNMAAVIFLPAVVIIADSLGGGSSYTGDVSELQQARRNMGSCFLGTVIASMLGLPLVLLHAGIVNSSAFGLWVASTVITASGSTAFLIIRGRKVL